MEITNNGGRLRDWWEGTPESMEGTVIGIEDLGLKG